MVHSFGHWRRSSSRIALHGQSRSKSLLLPEENYWLREKLSRQECRKIYWQEGKRHRQSAELVSRSHSVWNRVLTKFNVKTTRLYIFVWLWDLLRHALSLQWENRNHPVNLAGIRVIFGNHFLEDRRLFLGWILWFPWLSSESFVVICTHNTVLCS